MTPSRNFFVNILDLSSSDLESHLASLGEPAFRARQVFQWLWQKGARSFDDMTNVSKDLRARLAGSCVLEHPGVEAAQTSRDGTIKLLLGLADGESVETVLIPAEDHFTQCLSTQVGCAMACAFCATGHTGFTRDMTSGEILSQVVLGREHALDAGMKIKNLVFMGMGEPLLNMKQLVPALEILNDPLGFGFSRRRITVSTCGLPKGLAELGRTGLALPAISLHAPTHKLREQIMPKAAKVPLDELMDAIRAYPLRPRERTTFEYVLLGGVNDTPEHARQLAALLSGTKGKINLIAYNPWPGSPFKAPTDQDVLAFEKILWSKNLTAILRRSMGQDIEAACGQLRAGRQGAR